MAPDEVLIIGAGPFGLSISAHLSALDIGHRIVGRAMESWRAHMPAGMRLKSEPYASEIAAPDRGFDVRTYCEQQGIAYNHRVEPLSVDGFTDYGDWFAKELVPGITDITVTAVEAVTGGFKVSFADADPIIARQVVVASGALPFTTIPDELAGLPKDLVTHTAEHRDLKKLGGRKVAVIGAGQSALETAALLHEAGAEVQLVVRRSFVQWLDPNPETISGLGYVKRPVTKLCEGWHCAFWNSPAAFRRLPRDMRITKARTVLGPAGAWWLKDRVDGVIETLTSHRVRHAQSRGTGVRLMLDGARQHTLDTDHVIAGTGFRIDLSKLIFLGDPLRGRVETLAGYPVLNRAGESTVPGLYFVGAPAAVSIGPSARFIAGTHTAVRPLVKSIAHQAKSGRSAAAT
ncbi:MAG: NAD(P)-binding domain-containing protein [Nocardiopsaceae bacterium]|jgi:thioredoxin reductase|nr:NAD(P)-binding domain-containing protein [Nocardiopsaceae bacterium]